VVSDTTAQGVLVSIHFDVDWLRVIRVLTQYVAPALVISVLMAELTEVSLASLPLRSAYGYLVAIVFSLLTIVMIGLCGWIVFLWDIDRLFFSLERKIDTQFTADAASGEEPDGSLLSRAREMLNSKVQQVRTQAVGVIEKAYWEDINAGGVLAFPQPDIAGAVEQIDKSRRDLLAPLTDLVATKLPLGSGAASIVSRMIFRYVAPEVKVRLYRRLVLRFLSQLGALFALTALCFFLSIVGWSRVAGSVFNQTDVSSTSVMLYQLDLMLRGALFDFMEHTHRSVSPITINQSATAFVYYTLLFRMFVAVYVISSLFRVVRFVARRWRALLR
jgi:hypothetical protein